MSGPRRGATGPGSWDPPSPHPRPPRLAVAVFGVGAAAGGILGGFLGSGLARAEQRYLPLFMALTTALGIVPCVALLDDPT